MSPEEILRLIREGENDRVEFRAELPPGDLIARTLAAFANSEGGTLLLGVDDSGQIRGLSQEELVDAHGNPQSQQKPTPKFIKHWGADSQNPHKKGENPRNLMEVQRATL